MKVTKDKQLEQEAFNLGKTACENNQPRLPYMDKKMRTIFREHTKIGETIPYMKAWLRGFDKCTLDKP